ncbi:MutS-related protein [Anaerocolumna chitinilytica]|uniref:DNA mismatch repair protein MutS n=1 Tax=Anaerocolumna chitinilytica TaxID=1727145 RepID=A0A7I8DR33_9FIRM|nr:hypothetical protein [Anaerocolumna chitinilytica]BCJ99774.1 DNA mismatch repair protein MutS [Anaerocolumna chitinilytica]
MEILLGILVLFLIFLIKGIYDKRAWYKNLRQKMINDWGKVPEEEYTTEKFESLSAYYNTQLDKSKDVDDITWNDINMEEIFMLINNTGSAIGEEYLYAMLHKLEFSGEKLKEREKLMNLFADREDLRLELQLALYKMGKISNVSVYEYINRLEGLETKKIWPHLLMGAGFIVSVILIPFNPLIGGILTALMLGNNVYQYYRERAKIEIYFTVCAYIVRLLEGVNTIIKLNIPEINDYAVKLKKSKGVFQKFIRGSFLLIPKNAGGDLLGVFLDYLNLIFHIDLIKFYSMLDCFKANREALNMIYETVGLLDSCIAAASFRKMIPFYSIPDLNNTVKPFLEVEDIYNPMIDEPVLNSIHTKNSVLITGSNASGKSTFIKTLAVNAILSQTIYTSLSSSYKASFFKVLSSMALKDNLLGKESYYIVEIKSLKRIIDRTEEHIPTLCFVDEVLRGTNTLERIAASSQILKFLSEINTICFAATHDIELTHILENFYSNYHFKEQIVENNVLFDYKLIEGRAVSKNAIKLLEVMGYPSIVTESASDNAEYFLKEGKWNILKS